MKYVICCVIGLLFTVDAYGFRRSRSYYYYPSYSNNYSAPQTLQPQPAPQIQQPTPDLKTSDVESSMLECVNVERRRYGLIPLILDGFVHGIARNHSCWMSSHYSMTHSGQPCAENIAMGQPDVQSVTNCWMNSPGHRANILNPNYRYIGVSASRASNGTLFWCQNFR